MPNPALLSLAWSDTIVRNSWKIFSFTSPVPFHLLFSYCVSTTTVSAVLWLTANWQHRRQHRKVSPKALPRVHMPKLWRLQNVSSNFAGTGKSRASSSVMFPWIKWTNNMDPIHPTIKTDPLLWCCSMPFGMNSCSFPSSLLFHIQNLGFCWLSKKMSHQGGNLVRVCWLPPHVSITQQRLNKGVSLSPVSARPQKPNDLPPRLPRWKTNKPFRTGNTPHFQT